MSLRLKCPSCRAAFVTSDDRAGRRVACPKCGAELVAPSTAIVEPPAAPKPEGSVFVPATDAARPRRGHPILWTLLIVLPLATVVGIVAWPRLRAWWNPVPPDLVERVATAYLRALAEGDSKLSGQLATVEDPPAIRSYRQVGHLRDRDRTIRGSFRPIAALHARIDETYVYDPQIGRFQPRNPLGAAAETLDTLHAAKAEQEDVAKKIAGGTPDEQIDAALKLAEPFSKLAEGLLAPKKLIPTYAQLVADAKPPLPPSEKELALDFGTHPETWDRLLKRPFPTLKADGPYILDRAEVSATVMDKLASSGDPPSRLRLKLLRFRLEGIDTGWRVVSARREGDPEPAPSPTEEAPPEPPRRSPGETVP